MASSLGQVQSMASNMFSAYASVAASMMMFRSMSNQVLPQPLKLYFYTKFGHLFKQLFGRFFTENQTRMTIVVDEHTGMSPNQIYEAAEVYLRSRINPKVSRLKANKTHKQKSIIISMEKGEEVTDTFKDFELIWQFVLVEPEAEKQMVRPDKRYFHLKFDTVHQETVVNDYLPFVLLKAKELKEKDKNVKLYTRDGSIYQNDDEDRGPGSGPWKCVNFDHPVTFDKMSMEPELKQSVIDDLDRFVRRRDYYKKVGKMWKRGYLLHGPPGTGKSSLIAAIANYLKFDVYDLELSSLRNNTDFRRVLLSTKNKSIIVIEDIDCSSQTLRRLPGGKNETDNKDFTLSGLLNFMDGLWSTCGDERIIIFTTNHKDMLDPALLRPGRMDMHIYMGYCTPNGFDVLAYNYLGVNDHRLFPEIKEATTELDITPAEIAEHLMRNEEVDIALEGVLDLLAQKKNDKKNTDEDKAKELTNGGESVESDMKAKKRMQLTSTRGRSSKRMKGCTNCDVDDDYEDEDYNDYVIMY